MRIGRLEFGIVAYNAPKNWKVYFTAEYDKACCGCHILGVSVFYITWMGDECYFNPPENEEVS